MKLIRIIFKVNEPINRGTMLQTKYIPGILLSILNEFLDFNALKVLLSDAILSLSMLRFVY